MSEDDIRHEQEPIEPPVTPEEHVAPEEHVIPEEPVVPTEPVSLSTDEGMAASPQAPAPGVTESDRLMAAVAYASQVFLPVIVPAIMLLAEENKKRDFQRYHAIQSLGFLVAATIYEVLASIVFCGLSTITGGCLACITWVLFLVPVIPAFYYAYMAYQGLYFDIPILTDFLVQNRWLDRPQA